MADCKNQPHSALALLLFTQMVILPIASGMQNHYVGIVVSFNIQFLYTFLFNLNVILSLYVSE